jgi:hypothetical protein
MAKKGWTWAPNRHLKPGVPDDLKAEVQAKANELIEDFLKPDFIKKPPKNYRWNYIIGIHAKWHRSFFYFVATFRSSRGITPTFESPFTRLEYVGNRRFNMAYMRHTGKWWEVHKGVTLEECIQTIREEGIFQP